MNYEELDRMYNEAMKGSDSPKHMFVTVPKVGLVEIWDGHVLVDGLESTEEQRMAILDWQRAEIQKRI